MKVSKIFEGIREQSILEVLADKIMVFIMNKIKRGEYDGEVGYINNLVSWEDTDKLGEYLRDVSIHLSTQLEEKGVYHQLFQEITLRVEPERDYINDIDDEFSLRSTLIHELRHAYEFNSYYHFLHKNRDIHGRGVRNDEYTNINYLGKQSEINARVSEVMSAIREAIKVSGQAYKNLSNHDKIEIILDIMIDKRLVDIFTNGKKIPFGNKYFRKILNKIYKYFEECIKRADKDGE